MQAKAIKLRKLQAIQASATQQIWYNVGIGVNSGSSVSNQMLLHDHNSQISTESKVGSALSKVGRSCVDSYRTKSGGDNEHKSALAIASRVGKTSAYT